MLSVTSNRDEHRARVVVPDDQLSLAIGNKGQNVRLAAKLTGWRDLRRNETKLSRRSLFVIGVMELVGANSFKPRMDTDEYG